MHQTSYPQILLSSKLGDGGFYKRYQGEKSNSIFAFTSSKLDYICSVRDDIVSLGLKASPLKLMKSGYKESSFSYTFRTLTDKRLTEIYNLSTSETISFLNKEGLIRLYLDDGSYHKNRHFGHLYCNSFSEDESKLLIDAFYRFYPVKKCKLRIDKKKDGRKYFYIYLPTYVMKEFTVDVLHFLQEKNIESLKYKAGIPSQTIERV